MKNEETCELLDKKFGIKSKLSFSRGEGQLPLAKLRSESGHEASVYLFGATIVSWSTPKREELLYLSPSSDFSGTKPIRGGIPLVFPQFGNGSLPPHGFARTQHWEPTSSAQHQDGSVSLTLSIAQTKETLAIWPHQFSATLELRLADSLSTFFRLENSGKEAFQFQNAFHTYFTVGHVNNVEVTRLGGLTYLDSTKNRAPQVQQERSVRFTSETDRIYLNAPDLVEIHDELRKRTIRIEKKNLTDAVVWNPWIERCRAIADLPDDAYLHYICVESANFSAPVKLSPGARWECAQTLSYQQ